MWEQKRFGIILVVEELNSSVVLVESSESFHFCEKVGRKTVALAKTFLTKQNEFNAK